MQLCTTIFRTFTIRTGDTSCNNSAKLFLITEQLTKCSFNRFHLRRNKVSQFNISPNKSLEISSAASNFIVSTARTPSNLLRIFKTSSVRSSHDLESLLESVVLNYTILLILTYNVYPKFFF